jgi:hypothetical protein
LLSAVPIAELRFWIQSTDRRAVNIPKGNGIGSREILKKVAKFPFSPSPQITTGRRMVKGTPDVQMAFSAASFDFP